MGSETKLVARRLRLAMLASASECQAQHGAWCWGGYAWGVKGVSGRSPAGAVGGRLSGQGHG